MRGSTGLFPSQNSPLYGLLLVYNLTHYFVFFVYRTLTGFIRGMVSVLNYTGMKGPSLTMFDSAPYTGKLEDHCCISWPPHHNCQLINLYTCIDWLALHSKFSNMCIYMAWLCQNLLNAKYSTLKRKPLLGWYDFWYIEFFTDWAVVHLCLILLYSYHTCLWGLSI